MTPWLVVGGLILFGIRELMLVRLERLGGFNTAALAGAIGHFLLAVSLTAWTVTQ